MVEALWKPLFPLQGFVQSFHYTSQIGVLRVAICVLHLQIKTDESSLLQANEPSRLSVHEEVLIN